MPLFLVETIHTHRIRFLVEAADEICARDTVAMDSDDLIEYDQKYLGSQEVSVRKLKRKQAEKLHRSDEVQETGSPYIELDRLINKE